MFSRYKVIFTLLIIILLALVIFLLLRDRGKNEDKFIEVYIQLSVAQLKFGNEPQKFEAEKKKIFSEYKFSQKELDRLLKSYRKNPERWVKLWERINQRLSELIEREKPHPSK